MQTKVSWKVDANAVAFEVQQELVLQPTRFAISYEALELMYWQALGARIQAKQQAAKKLVRPT